MYNVGLKVYDEDLLDIDDSNCEFNIRDVKLGIGKGFIKEVYSDNSFVVKFENEKNLIMYLSNGHRYDRDSKNGSKQLLIIDRKEIILRYKIAKILNSNLVELHLNKNRKLNQSSIIKIFKDKGYSPTNIKKYLNDILNKNTSLNKEYSNDFKINDCYFYDYLKTKSKNEIKEYFVFLKEYYK